MRVEHEGGVVVWLVGTLVSPSVSGRRTSSTIGVIVLSESLSEPLVAGDQNSCLTSLSPLLCPFRHLAGSLSQGPSLLFGVSGT